MSRRRIICPACDCRLIVTPAAEERGRMRCPDCSEVVDVTPEETESPGERLRRLAAERAAQPRPPEEDHDYVGDGDRPQRRKKRREEKSNMWIGVVLALGFVGLLALCGGCIGVAAYLSSDEAEESLVPLMTARSGFRTNITSPQTITEGPAPAPPAELATKWQLTRYQSPIGKMAAYITRDPRDGRRRPALLFAHGGFGGVHSDMLEEEQVPAIFAKGGLVVMCPSWRGENDNPGQYEMFYGEVDDAVAAVEHLARLPYVDPNRIYMAGHSTGGTITLLTVEATFKLRAAFSFGGAPDIGSQVRFTGIGYGNTPFDWRDKKERRLRSAIDFIHHVRTPTFYFEGGDDADYLDDARKMEQWARKGGAPVQTFIIDGGSHFDIPEPISELLVEKIRADTGPTCTIRLTQGEVQRAYENYFDE